jgi:amidohydrolase
MTTAYAYLLPTLKTHANNIANELIATRRHIHSNPELSFNEHNTAAYIIQQLQNIGITNIQPCATTGVVAIIDGQNPTQKVTALRADMDALPITEENDVPYKSQNIGVMHACGHDVHTTCLIGAAKLLFATKENWHGTIKLIFQPGEEKNPGGASLMIKDGVLENPAPEKIFGMHVHPQMEVGTFSFRGGVVMASTDELYITITGPGGHAAAPHKTTDIVLVAAQIITGLQQIISRNNDPFNPSVLSITSIQGGNTTNVIPSKLELKGTLRCMNEEWRTKAHSLITKYVSETAQTFGAAAAVNIDIGYPMVYNNEALSSHAKAMAIINKGEHAISTTELRMGAEDFAFYGQHISACFFRLGAGNAAKGIIHNVHTPIFNVDEACIVEGAIMMAWLGITG